VRNAARLAVYVETMIRVKNHQTLPTIRPDADLPVPPEELMVVAAVPLADL